MTPGYAKTRQELPWLYYPEADSVIISAHNFGGAFSPAVNGKTPVAAWIPSRDDAGNGTTTLTDLVGSNNGTLTNMDAATDWVADTDSGGVRALDFDGSNDYVSVGTPITTFAAFSVSCWAYGVGANVDKIVLGQRDSESIGWWELIHRSGGWRFELKPGNGSTARYSPFGTYTAGVWQHLVGTFDGSTIRLYVDGVEAGAGTAWSGLIPAPVVAAGIASINGISSVLSFAGGVDDVRVWEVALDATDAADLATGRGVNVA